MNKVASSIAAAKRGPKLAVTSGFKSLTAPPPNTVPILDAKGEIMANISPHW